MEVIPLSLHISIGRAKEDANRVLHLTPLRYKKSTIAGGVARTASRVSTGWTDFFQSYRKETAHAMSE
jgi:hypothetical protein